MKHAYLFPGLALLVSFSVACATAEEDNFGGAGGGGGMTGQGTTVASSTQAVTSNVAASTTVGTTAAGGMCPSSCNADAVCQNSCPALGANLSNCCDLQTSTCYVNNAPSCPPPQTVTTGASMY